MSGYSLSPEADQDLGDIWDYIARDDAEAADRWIYKLRDAFRLLAENPQLGHTRKDLTDKKVRFWPVGKHLILYRFSRKTLKSLPSLKAHATYPPTFAAAPERCSFVTQH